MGVMNRGFASREYLKVESSSKLYVLQIHRNYKIEYGEGDLVKETGTAMSYQEISVTELKQKLDSGGEGAQFIDVRESDELEEASLTGFTHLPLSGYQQWSESLEQHLDPVRETIVLCHHGLRSADMCSYLIGRGFTDVKNVRGGIHAYALYADPNVPKYS